MITGIPALQRSCSSPCDVAVRASRGTSSSSPSSESRLSQGTNIGSVHSPWGDPSVSTSAWNPKTVPAGSGMLRDSMLQVWLQLFLSVEMETAKLSKGYRYVSLQLSLETVQRKPK